MSKSAEPVPKQKDVETWRSSKLTDAERTVIKRNLGFREISSIHAKDAFEIELTATGIGKR